MSELQPNTRDDNDLRHRAEAEWIQNSGQAAFPATGAEAMCLLHELQVHQIELEMQNNELRHAKEQTREDVDELETLYRHAPAIMLLVDREQRIYKANECAAVFAGRPAEELPGTRCGETLHCMHAQENTQGCGFGSFCGDCPIRRAIVEAIDTGKACEQEEFTLSVPGKEDPLAPMFLLSCARLHLHGTPMALVTLLDITQRNRTEAEKDHLATQLRQSEKLTALGQLAGGIAHNFNNQLVGIMGYADMLCACLQDPDHKRYAGNILSASRRSADLVKQILSFARKGKRVSMRVDLHALLEETLSILQSSIDGRLVCTRHFGAESATVIGDPSQFQNVFLNLGLNARDAMPEGGEISFATAVIDLPPAEAQALHVEPGCYIQATVSDTGSGLSQEALAHLFEPFFTTKEVGKGTGLGLAAAHGAIIDHGGTITGRNRSEGGAVFTVSLPLADVGRVSRGEVLKATPFKSRVRVLLVDDECIIRDMGADMLRTMGCDVTTCIDGVEAIARYCECWRHIDVVILDLAMPRMRGSDVFVALREINPDAKVLIVSGYSLDEEVETLLTEGANSFLQKPFTSEALSQKVVDLMKCGKEPSRVEGCVMPQLEKGNNDQA